MRPVASAIYNAGAGSCAHCKDNVTKQSGEPRFTPRHLQTPSPPLSNSPVSPPVVCDRHETQSPQQSPPSKQRCNSLGIQRLSSGADNSWPTKSDSDGFSRRHGSSQLRTNSMPSVPNISVLGKPSRTSRKKPVLPNLQGPILSPQIFAASRSAIVAYMSTRLNLGADTEAPVGLIFKPAF